MLKGGFKKCFTLGPFRSQLFSDSYMPHFYTTFKTPARFLRVHSVFALRVSACSHTLR